MNRRLSCLLVAHGAMAGFFAVVLACGANGEDPSNTPSCPTLALPETCPSSPPSWKTEVQPLVAKYCYGCHLAGGVGYSTADLSTYAGVLKKDSTIGQQVSECLMPQLDAGQQPTPAERETLITWALTCRAPNN